MSDSLFMSRLVVWLNHTLETKRERERERARERE